MTRKNNPADMTIREQIEKIKGQFCDDFCKYRGAYDGYLAAYEGLDEPLKSQVTEANELALSMRCEKCPLSRL